MKSFIKIFAALFLICMIQVSNGQGIVGSAHDFSTDNYGTTEICILCHTPHAADITVTDAPLWNHEVTNATFQLYTSSTLTATLGQPDGNSKLCLSCHDGTIAIDNFGGATGGSDFVTGGELIGTDLRDDHPISFTYNTLLATDDGGLFDPSSVNTFLGGTINDDLLFSGKLQCASCHDVHDALGNDNLLVIANTASALCLTCHNK